VSPTDRALDDLHDEMQIREVARELRNVPLAHDNVRYALACAVKAGRITQSQVEQFWRAAVEREELRLVDHWKRMRSAFG
jgi:hypothetical protein